MRATKEVEQAVTVTNFEELWKIYHSYTFGQLVKLLDMTAVGSYQQNLELCSHDQVSVMMNKLARTTDSQRAQLTRSLKKAMR